MELHSYAKRRAKKWTIEQKRKLVEARISYDGIFSKKPTNCLTTWKKIVALAKLDDFNVSFVRKQWSNMVAKYKQYKQNRLGNMPVNAIDDAVLRKVSQEWEFFYPIHCLMSRRVTNMHSYALTQGQKHRPVPLTQQQQQEQEEDNASLATQLQSMLASDANANAVIDVASPEIITAQNLVVFSSDTNEDFAAAETIAASAVDDLTMHPNTDHDFYSKKSPVQGNCFDVDNNVIDNVAMTVEATACDTTAVVESVEVPQTDAIKIKPSAANNIHETVVPVVSIKNKSSFNKAQLNGEQPAPSGTFKNAAKAQTSSQQQQQNNNSSNSKKPKLSERDKYYRHKRRYNRRLEHRFDLLLNVFGQIVRAEYPSIDVRPLLGGGASFAGAANLNGNGGGGGEGARFSSDEDSSEAEPCTSNEDCRGSQAESTLDDDELLDAW